MGRIVWNHSEKSAIFAEMVEVLIEEPNMHPRDVLARCQTVLPVNRRRDVTYNMIFNYKGLVVKAEAEANRKRPKRVKPEPTPVSVELGSSELLDKLMSKFAAMVADEILKKQPKSFHIQHPAPTRSGLQPAPKEVCEPKPETPGVLIIGLNGHQMNITRTRFPRKDIMFLHVDDASSHAAIKRDHTILMTKFISHSIQDKYRHAPNLHYCNGGLSELNTILNNIR